MIKLFRKLLLKLRLKKLGIDLSQIKKDIYWSNVREKMRIDNLSYNDLILDRFKNEKDLQY